MNCFLISSIFDLASISLSNSILLVFNLFIVSSNLSETIFIFLPSSFISSSLSWILYFLEKFKFAIPFAISLSSSIGFVNLSVITKIAIPLKIIDTTPITAKNLFDKSTLSWIGVIGILIYNKFPLLSFASKSINPSPFFLSCIFLIVVLSFEYIISDLLNILYSTSYFISAKLFSLKFPKKFLFDAYISSFSFKISISKLLLRAIFSNSTEYPSIFSSSKNFGIFSSIYL